MIHCRYLLPGLIHIDFMTFFLTFLLFRVYQISTVNKLYQYPTVHGAQGLLPRNSLILSTHHKHLKWPSEPIISSLHTSSSNSEPGDGESKVEQAVKAIQEKKKARELSASERDELLHNTPQVLFPKKSLATRFKDEVLHFWNGFKLLWTEMKIAGRLLRQVLNGHTLSRREYKQVLKIWMDCFNSEQKSSPLFNSSHLNLFLL